MYHDLSQYEEKKQQEMIEVIKRVDRKRGFHLSKDVLIRFSLIRTAKQEYQLMISFHHILIDGWSVGILLQDLLDIYEHVLRHQPPPFKKVPSYSQYIQWLEEQDDHAARTYWNQSLQGVEQVTAIPTLRGAEETKRTTSYTTFLFHLGKDLTTRLSQLAQAHRVTLNNVIQSIWGILLQKYLQTNDVVFGAVVSGRNFEIPQIDEMVGLFIHTIPVRIRVEKGTSFRELIQHIQKEALRSKRYQYLSLADIQAEAGINGSLFDHLITFEHFSMDVEGINREKLSFHITNIEAL